MEFENRYIVYVKTNPSGHITAVNSSAFLTDATGWMEIDRGYGDKYHHAQGNYFDTPLYTDDGICRWKYVDGQCVLRTDAEIEGDRVAMPDPEQPSESSVWDELDAAYQEGVDSV